MTANSSHEVLDHGAPLPVDIGEELDSFLLDPIGFGTFDPTDPITLDEFSTCRHHRTRYMAVLAR